MALAAWASPAATLPSINSGTITGGLAGDGATRANAITFTGGSNTLELQAGSSITGNVVAGGTNDTLRLGAATAATFDMSQVGAAAQYQGFESFEKTGSSTWTLTGASTHTGGTTVTAGTLMQGAAGAFAANTAYAVNGGTVDLGSAALTVNQAGNTSYAGVIAGSGSLTKSGAGTLTLMGTNIYAGGTTISDGTLQIGNGGTTGSIAGDVVNNGTLIFNRSNDLTFAGVISGTGSLVQAGTGTTVLTGNNTYTGVTTISQGTLQIGNGGTTGSIAGDVVNNSAFADAAITPNQGAVGAALDRIEAAGATGDMSTVMNSLLGLTASGARGAFDRMGGLSHLALTEAAFTSFRTYLNAVSGRMGGSISGRMVLAVPGLMMLASRGDVGSDAGSLLLAAVGNAGGAEEHSAGPGWGFWTRGYGGIGQARGDDLPEKYDYDTGGVVLGFDRRIGSNLVLGLSGGYSYTSVDMKDLPESGKISSWQGSLYAAYEAGAWYVNGIAAYSHNSFDTSREIAFGTISRKAGADYSGHVFGGYAETGYRFRTKPVDVIPMASFQAAHLIREGFTETAAGALGLDVGKEQETSLAGSLGMRMRKEYRAGSGTLTPELRAAWLHQFSRSDYEMEAGFSTVPASSFRVVGARTGKDSALVGAGIGWETRNLNLVLALDSSLSGDDTEYNLSLGLRYRW